MSKEAQILETLGILFSAISLYALITPRENSFFQKKGHHFLIVALFFLFFSWLHPLCSPTDRELLATLFTGMVPVLLGAVLYDHHHRSIHFLYFGQLGAILILLTGGFLRPTLPVFGSLSPWPNFFLQLVWSLMTLNILRLFRMFSILPHIFICSMGSFILLLYYLTGDYSSLLPLLIFLTLASLVGTICEMKFPNRGKRQELILGFYGFTFLAVLLITKIKGTGILLFAIPLIFLIHPVIFILYLLISSFIVSGIYRKTPAERGDLIKRQWRITPKNLALFFILFNLILQMVVLLRHYQVAAPLLFLGAICGSAPLFYFGYRLFMQSLPLADHPLSELPEIKILGMSIHNLFRRELLSAVEDNLLQSRKTVIVTPDTLAILRSQSDPEYFANISRATFRIADGVGVVWASNWVGTPLRERLPGIEIFQEICGIAARLRKTVYLLGAKKRVVEDAAFNLAQIIPGLRIVGFHDGYFQIGSAKEGEIIEEIKSLSPDIIFVAMGVPVQENFIARHQDSLPCSLFMGIGGSFDVLAGRLKRAPLLLQNLGLEWLYRLYLEPSRISRLAGIPLFIFKIIEFNLDSSFSEAS